MFKVGVRRVKDVKAKAVSLVFPEKKLFICYCK